MPPKAGETEGLPNSDGPELLLVPNDVKVADELAVVEVNEVAGPVSDFNEEKSGLSTSGIQLPSSDFKGVIR